MTQRSVYKERSFSPRALAVRMQRVEGRVAVVTGASEGIGEAIVRRLAAEGMKVAALARRLDMLKKIENEEKTKGFVVKSYKCDVQSESNVKEVFSNIQKDLGPIHVLVNNAAVLIPINLTDINLEASAKIVNTNILGVLSCTKQALASMKDNSINDGHIVNINSITGHREVFWLEGISVYSATKHAMTLLNSNLRNELISQKSKIRVSSISPGVVNTNMTADYLKKNPDWLALSPHDIADAVFYAISAPPSVNISEIIVDPV